MDFSLDTIKSMIGLSSASHGDGSIIGIDCGGSAIKVVQLHDEDGVPMLDTYGELQLGPYADMHVGAPTSLEPTRKIEALVDILRESSSTGNNATLAVPYAASFTTRITLDVTSANDIETQVPVVARKYVPVPLKEVTLDWFPLPCPPDTDTPATTIFLVAIHNDALQSLRSIVSGAGLSLAFTELEPFGIARAALPGGEGAHAILDCGASTTKLYLFEWGVLQQAHAIPFGGAALTTAAATALGIPVADAETKKRALGLTGDAALREALTPGVERMVRSVGKVIADYEQSHGLTFPTISLAGGGAAMPGFVPFVSDRLQRPAVLVTPFNKIAYPAFMEDTLRETGTPFAVAIGAALRKFAS